MTQLASASVPSVVAKVNGEPIYRSELSRAGRNAEGDPLERAILFHLAAQNARREKLDADPEVKYELSKVLYKAYVDRKLAGARIALDPSDREVQLYYEENPLVRVRRLTLDSSDDLGIVRKKLSEGKDFKTLVLEYAHDEAGRAESEPAFRGVENLPSEIYGPALKLKPGEVSEPIKADTSFRLVQLLERKPFAEAPPDYKDMLRTRLRQQREDRFLSSIFEQLKSSAKIEVFAKQEKK